MGKKITIIFFISTILAFASMFLPPKYTMAVYGLNFLGWMSIILILVAIITFSWLLLLDIKHKRKKELLRRTLFFLSLIVISIVYWFYQAKKMGNI